MASSPASADVPFAVKWYVGILGAFAAVDAVAAFWFVPAWWSVEHALPFAAYLGLLVFLQRNPFTFYWREHRLVVSLDETVVLVGLLILPAPLMVLGMAAGVLGLQLWRGPAARIKRAFNVVQYTLAAEISAATFLLATMAGAPPLGAAALAAFVFGVSVNLLLAGVFGFLSNVSPWGVFRERFLGQGSITGAVGISGGVLVVALWRLHPLATLTALPIAYLMRRYMTLHATADRELDVHRRLANTTHDLVGSASVAAVAERVLSECESLLDAGRATIVVEAPESQLRLSRDYGSGPQRTVQPLSEPLPAHGGGALGRLEVLPRQGKAPFGDQERELLRTIAGQAASAIENARAIAAADSARQKLDTYLATAPDAVLLVSFDGTIQYMNPAAWQLFVPDGDAAGLRATDLFDDPRLSMERGSLPDEPMLIEASAHARGSAERFLIEAHVGPVPEGGRVAGLLMVVRDVTERKRLEDESRKQREALAQSEKLSALGTLVAGVAHEINNPLTYMRGNLQLTAESVELRMQEADVSAAERQLLDEVAEGVKVSLEGVDRIREIATSLKNVAKKGTGKPQESDLNGIINEVLLVVKPAIPNMVRLELDLAPALTPIHVKTSEIHQILLNLVKNSVEALEGREDGLVRVRSWETEDAVHVEVADNGCGIPAEVQRSLFSPFFTTKENGTGLGLSISRGIAQAHGGALELASEVGEGTSFTLTLPKSAAAPTDGAPQPAGPAHGAQTS